MAPASKKRNLLGFGILYAFVLLLWVIAPPRFHQEAEAHCAGAGVVAKFGDMDACSRSPEFKREGCSCSRVPSELYRPYMVGVVPVLTTLLAYAVLRGSLLVRLLLLNVAFTAAVVTQFVWSLMENAAATLLTLSGLPLGLLVFLLGMSLLFAAITFLAERAFKRNTQSGAL